MGRVKKHFTEADKKQARREYVRKYYYKNKEKIDAKAREHYHRKKNGKGV